MIAWISPLRTSSSSPFRISLPSTATWRSLTIRSGVWLIRTLIAAVPDAAGCGQRNTPSVGRARSAGLRNRLLRREALAAGAAVTHIRVVELEPGAHQPFHEIHHRAGQQQRALG